ncbi:AhpD-like protein [Mariannaea sp. PMI_226]|nr:AhpD-like protein [Mariannaea sp. PMI_226]
MMAASTPIMTPALINYIRRQPHLPRNSWYFIAATTLSSLNRPDELPKIYSHALEEESSATEVNGNEYYLLVSRRIREALIKSSAVGGMPKTINALMALKAVTPEDLLDTPGIESRLSSRFQDIYNTPAPQIIERGQTFFDKLYGKISRRIMGQMDRSGSEDLGLMARLVYGYILSNADVLTPVETSFVLIASLIPQDVNPQLKGHLRGALNGGASPDEVRAVRDIVIKICEASGMRRLGQDSVGGWGWRSEIANV